ncbi:MAG: S8 family serine peptidase [Cryomorphaceae bacterium]|nr:S8 family serine peptidase [Cryomorphaceae bacterium]
MKKLLPVFFLLLFLNETNAQYSVSEENKQHLLTLAIQFQEAFTQLKSEAIAQAEELNLPVYYVGSDSVTYELSHFENDQPVYFQTNNVVAATSTSTNRVWPNGGAGLSLTGSGLTMREWDGGAVRVTHQEFGNRVVQGDNPSNLNNHATHVAGTLVASGFVAGAKGMAYEANLRAFDWNNDNSEMATEAAAGALISNHSYGSLAGWAFGDYGANHSGNNWYWWGNLSISTTEDYKFGFYNQKASDWDQLAYAAPHYLIVKSAGNNRGQSYAGTHWVWSNGNWVQSTASRAPSGGTNGYDCIPTYGTAKNILTVGAVNTVTGGYNQPSDVNMSTFSSWGPTDDGRIKPDIVGDGVSVYSPYAGSNSQYATISGTSMSGPNVAGSLLLLQQHFNNLNNTYMLASTLKALAIHTADETGNNAGPDYRFGWGILNTETAAQVISDTGTTFIIEETLPNNQTYTLPVVSDGITPIKVTLCWADPHAPANTPALNPTTIKLVNDLDVRILQPGSPSVEHQPWILNPANPAAAATKGDNIRDNVEVVAPGVLPAGNYEVVVTHKGSLVTASLGCIQTTPYGSANLSSANSTPTTLETCSWAGEYLNVSINSTGTYTFNSSNSTDYFTVTDNSNNVIATGNVPLSVGFSSTGSYRIHISENANCNTQNVCRNILGQFSGSGTSNPPLTASGQDFSLIVTGAGSGSPAPPTPVTSLPWTEDFSNGFTGWSGQGFSGQNPSANAAWEYRGPSTTPNNTVGSRGNFSATAGPIPSPTTQNGFAIFDSDYLDNNGTSNFGSGLAPTPHGAGLISPVLNFTGHNALMLSFHSRSRNFYSFFEVALSNDGGVTWFDTVTATAPSTNAAIRDEYIQLDISSIANEPDARIQFVMHSDPSQTQNGYYYWMIDDIEIAELPENDIRFYTESHVDDKVGVIMDNDTTMAKKLTQTLYQARPYNFEAKALNFGQNPQSNVRLSVVIKDENAVVVDSLWSPIISSVASKQVIHQWELRTPLWLPQSGGSFTAEYRVISDSISLLEAHIDTLVIVVSDSLIGHVSGNPIYNSIGTSQLGNDGSAIAVHINLDQPENAVGYHLMLANGTSAGGQVEFYLYDRSGINPGSSVLIASQVRNITAADVANGYLDGNFVSMGAPLGLPVGSYFLVAELFSVNGSNPIFILNDQSVISPVFTSQMFLTNISGWFSAYVGSRNFNAPALFLKGCKDSIECPNCNNFTATISQTDSIFCFGDSTASLLVTPQNGVGPYEYSWNGQPTISTPSISGLPAGTHQLVISDSRGCSDTITTTISQPATWSVSTTQTGAISCHGAQDGEATAAPAGGTPPFSFSWNTTPVQTGATATGLAAGVYNVEVTDGNNCTSSASVTITEPDSLVVSFPYVQDIDCYGNSTGKAFGLPVGGTPPYSFSWNTSPVQNTDSLVGVPAGTYTLTVTDANNCTAQDSIEILDAPFSNIVIITNLAVSCSGRNDGYLEVGGVGGTPPFSFLWNTSPTDTIAFIDNLAPGSYWVKVTDANGCIDTLHATVGDRDPLSLDSIQGVTFTGIGEQDTYVIPPVPDGDIFQWNVSGGTIISGQNNDTVVVEWNQLGIHTLEVEVQSQPTFSTFKCSFTHLEVEVHEKFSVNEEGMNTHGVKVFPNPSSGVFTITVDRPELYELMQIMDAQGKIIHQGSVSASQELDFRAYSAGVYVLRLGNHHFRVIIL